jgi:hypothetical protein
MSARIVPVVVEPRSAVNVHADVDDFRSEVAASETHPPPVRAPLVDWQAEEDGPLTPLVIELALAPAFAHRSAAVQAAARVARRHLELLIGGTRP